MAAKNFDCVVVGSGPGGYVAAIRAAQLGMKTGVIEKESPGGVCLNWGCIPTKAVLKSAEVFQTMKHAADYGLQVEGVKADFPGVINRSRKVVEKMTKGVEFLFKKNKIELVPGHGKFTSSSELSVAGPSGETTVGFKNAIIATGARPRTLPAASAPVIAGSARARTLPSLPVDGERILTYRHALDLRVCPQKLLIIGAGAIGIEFAYFYSSFGADVTVVEVMENILPIEDQDVSKGLERNFTKAGIKIKTKTMVESLTRKGQNISAILKTPEKVEEWNGDYCLVAVGFQGNVENIGLEALGIVPEKSFIKVDSAYRTKVPNVYAIGDVIGAPMLAHVASHEGIIAAETMAGKHPHPIDYKRDVPAGTYCQPQVASIGLTEKAAREAGYDVRVGKFPFTASGKAVATNETEGFVKVIIDAKVEEVLGVHILHPEATELIGEASIIHSHEGIASSVLNTIHAHPTLSETIMEAMGDALGRAIHI